MVMALLSVDKFSLRSDSAVFIIRIFVVQLVIVTRSISHRLGLAKHASSWMVNTSLIAAEADSTLPIGAGTLTE